MILAELSLGARQLVLPAVGTTLLLAVAILFSLLRSRQRQSVRWLAGGLKLLSAAIVCVCLLEPMFTGTRPRPGSNLFLVVADGSRSLQITDPGESQSRAAHMRQTLRDDAPWLARLGQDFDVRRYVLENGLEGVKTFQNIESKGESSPLAGTLNLLTERFRGRPLAGIILLTDGNATDIDDWSRRSPTIPPIYPIAIGNPGAIVDLSVTRVEVSQTNFEAAPVTLTAVMEGTGLKGQSLVIRVIDEEGNVLERRTVSDWTGSEPRVERFLIRPEKTGICFYQVQTALLEEERRLTEPGSGLEMTYENNQRTATVDRGGGPYRVLYVGGRPSWEFKFLRRAIDADDEVDLIGLVRIARKEPKFAFMGRSGERTNPLFRGFTGTDEQTEQYDEPVLVRLGTADENELRGGFPKGAEELFPYHAVILDDIEQAFFNQDQLSLLREFVSQRGGGLLMLGGVESFVEGGYVRGPVNEMLPVYLDKATGERGGRPDTYKLQLTREGWLQPWIRLRSNEADEQSRLAGMPEFSSLNRATSIKPGASVLATVTSSAGEQLPALVVQQFGRGRTSALMIGDLWRWNMRRTDHKQSDLDKAWRQLLRWLVSDVPARVDVSTTAAGPSGGRQIRIKARDSAFQPLDNAIVKLQVTTPDKTTVDLSIDPTGSTPGEYNATYFPRVPGNYRVQAQVTDPDGSEVGEREAGWSYEPRTEEFRSLGVNHQLLDRLAKDTEGEVITANQLDDFVESLPNRKMPVVETWTYPLWDRWPVLTVALICLAGEWGLRRWKGLP